MLSLSLFDWVATTLIGILILPIVLGWLPTIFDFLINFVFWLIWILKYRNNHQ